jgi:hypothetical protein
LAGGRACYRAFCVPSHSHFSSKTQQVKNSAGEDAKEGVRVTATEEHDLPGSRGTANFVCKWVRDAKHAASIVVETTVKGVTRDLTGEDEGAWVPVCGFECRGIEPTALHLGGGFTVTTPAGTVFEDVDLSEGDWVDFDEKGGDSVGIYGMEARFEVRR